MSKKIDWIWVDCFTKLPILFNNYKIFKDLNYKLCLVSPELHNQDLKLELYKNYLQKEDIIFDAICTKLHNIIRWTK